MKVLFAGDSHGNSKYIGRLLDVAEDNHCDRIFILGDFGYWEHDGSGIDYLNRVNELACGVGPDKEIMVYFIRGNHDKSSLLLEKYTARDDEGFIFIRSNVLYAPDGHVWDWSGTKFMALGGAYSTDKMIRLKIEKERSAKIARQNTYRTTAQQRSTDTSETLWFPEEEMSDEDMDRHISNVDSVDVILAHDKPIRSNPAWNRKDIPECHHNQRRLQNAVDKLRPKVYLHGHLHYHYMDTIEFDDETTIVIGLDSDPQSSYSNKLSDSYRIVKLPIE